jgi:hypothetical protein
MRALARVLGLVATLAFAAAPVPVMATVASDLPGAILVFPRVIVDTTVPPQTPDGRVDTLIRISNTSEQPVTLKCFYVNANGHCRGAPGVICDPYNPNAVNNCAPDDFCIPGWQETDFVVNITARQPVAWLASQGSTLCEQSPNPEIPCLPLGDRRAGIGGQTNRDSRVPPVPENPFLGNLRCIAVDRNEVPIDRNALKGEVEIIRSNEGDFDVQAYNAIGIRALEGRNDGDNTLVMGGSGQCQGGSRSGNPCGGDGECPSGICRLPEYEGCPNILILDHFFEGANDPVSGAEVNTALTLVPCTEDYERQNPVTAPIQFLVFNEFEQRFSTSRIINCFHEFRLFDIDGATPGEVRSIFSAAVNGTLTGQTRMRGVAGDDTRLGYTWLGVAEELREGAGSAAYNVHHHGARPQSDFIHLP